MMVVVEEAKAAVVVVADTNANEIILTFLFQVQIYEARNKKVKLDHSSYLQELYSKARY
jgi:hypothetical protein